MSVKKHALALLFSLLFSTTNIYASTCTTLFEQQDFPYIMQQCIEEASHNIAYSNLIPGYFYENELGEQLNINPSLSYYRKAVLNNDVDAQIALGKYHAKHKNYLQSHMFFTLAVENGSLRALRYRDKIEQNLTIQEMNFSKSYLDVVKSAIVQNKTQFVFN